MGRDQQILDDPSADQVLLNNPLERGRIALAVPRALGIDNRNRAALADPQAVRFRPQDAALVGEPQLTKAAFQEIPRRHAALHVAALRLGLLGAEKDVALRDGNADGVRDLDQCITHYRVPITGFRNGSVPGTVQSFTRPSHSDRLFSTQEYSISSPVV